MNLFPFQDLQVKSPPTSTKEEQIFSDPAIIQSQYSEVPSRTPTASVAQSAATQVSGAPSFSTTTYWPEYSGISGSSSHSLLHSSPFQNHMGSLAPTSSSSSFLVPSPKFQAPLLPSLPLPTSARKFNMPLLAGWCMWHFEISVPGSFTLKQLTHRSKNRSLDSVFLD
ncbi:hypothetical protein K1719_047271 [Acacia pycnantha]|nr:hypothetical protein K1719_047271 [Acacia pycnantha]